MKYEEVYLKAYETVSDVRAGLRKYFQFYNTRRPHSSLETANPGSGLLQPAVHTPGGLINGGGDPLITVKNLSKQMGPPL